MIKYTEKGEGLHQAIQDAGHRLMNLDGVWVSDDDVAVQAIIDSYVVDALAELEAKAQKYIEFGTDLSTTLVAKFWAQNVSDASTGTLISATDLTALLQATSVANQMLQTGALTQVKDVLAQIKAAWPRYSSIMDYATNEINTWLSTPWLSTP